MRGRRSFMLFGFLYQGACFEVRNTSMMSEHQLIITVTASCQELQLLIIVTPLNILTIVAISKTRANMILKNCNACRYFFLIIADDILSNNINSYINTAYINCTYVASWSGFTGFIYSLGT